MSADHHVFKSGHFGKQTDILKRTRNTGLGHFMHGRRFIGRPAQLKCAAVRRVESGDYVEERVLPAPLGPIRP